MVEPSFTNQKEQVGLKEGISVGTLVGFRVVGFKLGRLVELMVGEDGYTVGIIEGGLDGL